MAKLPSIEFKHANQTGEVMKFKAEVSITNDGTFSVTIPDELVETARANARRPEPSAVIARPPANVHRTPTCSISNEPGAAAIANRITGMPVRIPISVPDSCRSDWISEITGGTASTLRRRPAPQIHSSSPDM